MYKSLKRKLQSNDGADVIHAADADDDVYAGSGREVNCCHLPVNNVSSAVFILLYAGFCPKLLSSPEWPLMSAD